MARGEGSGASHGARKAAFAWHVPRGGPTVGLDFLQYLPTPLIPTNKQLLARNSYSRCELVASTAEALLGCSSSPLLLLLHEDTNRSRARGGPPGGVRLGAPLVVAPRAFRPLGELRRLRAAAVASGAPSTAKSGNCAVTVGGARASGGGGAAARRQRARGGAAGLPQPAARHALLVEPDRHAGGALADRAAAARAGGGRRARDRQAAADLAAGDGGELPRRPRPAAHPEALLPDLVRPPARGDARPRRVPPRARLARGGAHLPLPRARLAVHRRRDDHGDHRPLRPADARRADLALRPQHPVRRRAILGAILCAVLLRRAPHSTGTRTCRSPSSS